mmetsp:Transcript_4669/g.14111  ORF Transcript_4669/g.14111 Transcript_4669/m.14111 type:complete len:137 (-) Transcript_4669:152-562(-)
MTGPEGQNGQAARLRQSATMHRKLLGSLRLSGNLSKSMRLVRRDVRTEMEDPFDADGAWADMRRGERKRPRVGVKPDSQDEARKVEVVRETSRCRKPIFAERDSYMEFVLEKRGLVGKIKQSSPLSLFRRKKMITV